MSKSHPEGNSNITYQSKNILDFFRQFISQRSCFGCWLAQWGMKQPGTHTPNHWSYQQRWVKPELKESHENMEPAGAGPELQGLQDAQVQGMGDHFSENTFYKPVSSVQSLSRVQLFATPWIAPHQASLSITNSQNLPKLMSIKLVMPSSHLILCRLFLLLPPIPPSIRDFSNESTLCMWWPKYWSFSFNISPSNEHPDLL